jgi:hypothetical protein
VPGKSKGNLADYTAYHWVGFIGAIAGVAGLILTTEVAHKHWWAAGAGGLLIILLWIESKRHHLSRFAAGVQDFIKIFPEHRSIEVMDDVQDSYMYLGVSLDTVSNALANWFENHPHKGRVRIRLLLTDPEAPEVWVRQPAYERKPGTPEAELEAVAADWRKAQAVALRKVSALPGVKEPVSLCYHREALHEFMHLVDGDQLYVGLLRRGVSNRECPVVVLKKRGDISLFHHYADWFEFLWEQGRKAELP